MAKKKNKHLKAKQNKATSKNSKGVGIRKSTEKRKNRRLKRTGRVKEPHYEPVGYETEQSSDYKWGKELQQLKNKYADIIKLANSRLAALRLENLISPALMRLGESFKEFTTAAVKTISQLYSELTKANVFISDPTSTPEMAKVYMQQEGYRQWLGHFGYNYATFENGWESYDTSFLDKETAEEAFRLYRMLEEEQAYRLKEYGSDKVIALMYDLVVQSGDPTGLDESGRINIINTASDFLSKEIGEEKIRLNESFERENVPSYLFKEEDFYDKMDF